MRLDELSNESPVSKAKLVAIQDWLNHPQSSKSSAGAEAILQDDEVTNMHH
jgi:hypothetical protein